MTIPLPIASGNSREKPGRSGVAARWYGLNHYAPKSARHRVDQKLHEIGFKHICSVAGDYLKAHPEQIEQARATIAAERNENQN